MHVGSALRRYVARALLTHRGSNSFRRSAYPRQLAQRKRMDHGNVEFRSAVVRSASTVFRPWLVIRPLGFRSGASRSAHVTPHSFLFCFQSRGKYRSPHSFKTTETKQVLGWRRTHIFFKRNTHIYIKKQPTPPTSQPNKQPTEQPTDHPTNEQANPPTKQSNQPAGERSAGRSAPWLRLPQLSLARARGAIETPRGPSGPDAPSPRATVGEIPTPPRHTVATGAEEEKRKRRWALFGLQVPPRVATAGVALEKP